MIEESEIENVDESTFVDNSFFTGADEQNSQDSESGLNFTEQFSPKQIGSIAKYTEPVGVNSPLETVVQMFKEDESLKVIPVEEMDHVIGFIDRKVVSDVSDSVWKKITAGNVIDYTQRVNVILNAHDFIEKTLQKVSDINRQYGIVYFPVFNNNNFFGMVSLDDFLDRIAEIREQDLAKASVIQTSFFPHDDIISKLPYRFHAWNKMANTLGGDIYQIYQFSEGKSLIACCDVSGKNVAASLLTIAVGSFFNTMYASKNAEKNPVKFISMLDLFLHRVVPSGNFITAVFCYVDKDNGKLCIFNCGHTTTYLISKDESDGQKRKIASIDPKLPPLGMGVVSEQLLASLTEKDGSKRPYVAFNLAHGMHLNMYSDGFTDMKNDSDQRFEDDNAKAVFQKMYDLNDDEIIFNIEETVTNWIGKTMLPDDVTVLDVRF